LLFGCKGTKKYVNHARFYEKISRIAVFLTGGAGKEERAPKWKEEMQKADKPGSLQIKKMDALVD